MGASLFAIVEVDECDRIRCQAPGCHQPVHKRIHVVCDGDRIVVVGSTCFARIYASAPDMNLSPRHGGAAGSLLTPEERAMLRDNTTAFVARMEQQAEQARMARVAIEAELRKAALPEQARWEAPPFDPNDSPYVAPEDTAGSQGEARHALQRFRAQQAAHAAREVTALNSAFRRFPERWIARAMVKAREDCVASGMKLDEPGSRQRIEAAALDLLERHYRG